MLRGHRGVTFGPKDPIHVSGRLSSCFREGAPTGRFAPQFAVALRTLAAFLMELSKEHIEAGAKNSMEHFVGWRMFPSVSHRDGKIVAVSASNADHLREQIALVFRIHIGPTRRSFIIS